MRKERRGGEEMSGMEGRGNERKGKERRGEEREKVERKGKKVGTPGPGDQGLDSRYQTSQTIKKHHRN